MQCTAGCPQALEHAPALAEVYSMRAVLMQLTSPLSQPVQRTQHLAPVVLCHHFRQPLVAIAQGVLL